MSNESLKVFFCYSRRDEALRDELESHLSGLINSGSIRAWYDRMIDPGSNWENELEDQLRTADIVLLLISADFLASKYCYNYEMYIALERHKRGEVCIIPVILRPCDWKHEPLNHLQALPKDGKPVVRQDCSIDAPLTDVAQGIRRVVEGLRKRRQPILPIPIDDPPPVKPLPRQLWLSNITRKFRILLFRRRYRFVHQVGLIIICLLVIVPIVALYISNPTTKNPTPQNPSLPIEKLISFGEESLLPPRKPNKYASDKNLGMLLFSRKDYPKAIEKFNTIRQEAEKVVASYPNDVQGQNPEKDAALEVLKDPEILIFRNNAQARKNHADTPNSPLYTIAVAAPTKESYGIHMLLGVAQAQDEAVKNKKLNLQVLIANDGNDPSQAEKLANELARNPTKVIAVIGHYTSSSTCSALPSYSKNNLAVISPGSTQFNIRTECGDSNKVFFRTVSSTRVEAESLVNYLLKKSGKANPKVVAFYTHGEKFSESLYQEFQTSLKTRGSIIGSYSLSQSDFSKKQYSIAVKEADALAIFPDGKILNTNNSFDRAITLIEDNQRDKLILGANSLYDMETLNGLTIPQSYDPLRSLIIAVDWHPKVAGAEVFVKKATENYWYGDVNYRTAMAYEAAQILIKILESDEVDKSRLGIKKQLSEFIPSRSLVSNSTVSFDKSGDRQGIEKVWVTPIFDKRSSKPKFCIVDSLVSKSSNPAHVTCQSFITY
jgi:ABC-type branched-subunit amino acid transport system substrate-binding protein